MIKILIVDDSPEKRASILDAIRSVPKAHELDIKEATCIISAKEKMLSETFDLCILDIHLPQRNDDTPRPRGGVDLITAVCSSPRYQRPRSIIALTAYQEIKDETSAAFANNNVVVLHYDRSVYGWQSTISIEVERLLVDHDRQNSDFGFDVCILTALHDPELKAVLQLDYSWSVAHCSSDSRQYYKGTLVSGDKSLRIAAMAAQQMGMPAAAVLASRMIHEFKPKYLVMAGIAAGVKGEVEYGDVLVADPSFDYLSGKLKAGENSNTFLPDPLPFRLDSFISDIVRSVAADENALTAIRSKWRGHKPNHNLAIRIGPLATGSTVLAFDGSLEETRTNWRKLIGFDLETYGVFCAANHFGVPRPFVLSAKAVTDFADGVKDDKWREYAAYTSAGVIDLVLQQLIKVV
ncbi:phosphorylase family protein [Prosthecobacter vanneervenii]|uniref:Nucleoside phosphorylase n=1 Tax=Prosthecobacter vanneervenii TaxID=48466 RepID=A0A7W7YEP1_9BACT|nr:hypothetical protein [Prosthecobacter vanneervenii]MBB5034485.1 nucleoside phosphorylase [Prosthecobacter vanneervenii]